MLLIVSHSQITESLCGTVAESSKGHVRGQLSAYYEQWQRFYSLNKQLRVSGLNTYSRNKFIDISKKYKIQHFIWDKMETETLVQM